MEVVIGLVMLMKTTTTSSGIAGGDGKRKDAEVAKWDEGEGSEEKKWVRGLLLLLPLLVP